VEEPARRGVSYCTVYETQASEARVARLCAIVHALRMFRIATKLVSSSINDVFSPERRYYDTTMRFVEV